MSLHALLAGVDNGRRGTLDKFLQAASTRPDEVLHYEFMQNYEVCCVHACMHACVCVCLCLCVCVWLCLCVCMRAHVCVHASTANQASASLAFLCLLCVLPNKGRCVPGMQALSQRPRLITRCITGCHSPLTATQQVQVKHTDGTFESKPYFCLPANDLNDVIAPSCYSCFDYTNALADIVVSEVGGMAARPQGAGATKRGAHTATPLPLVRPRARRWVTWPCPRREWI